MCVIGKAPGIAAFCRCRIGDCHLKGIDLLGVGGGECFASGTESDGMMGVDMLLE